MSRPPIDWVMRQVERDNRLKGRVPCADGCRCRRPLPLRMYCGQWACICGQCITVDVDDATEVA